MATQQLEPMGSAHAVPSSSLPPMPTAELPSAPPLRKLIGPGIIIAAVGLGSGEYILHPYITSQVGLTFLWAAVVGLGLQFFLNTEIIRYTISTGETILTGFMRSWRGWGPLFIAMTVIPFAWPAWMTSAAEMITFPLGGGNVTAISIGGLILIGLVLTLSPIVYKTLERLEFLKIALVLFFAAFAVVALIGWEPWAALPSATIQGFGRMPQDVPTEVLVSAMVFAGGGGAVNLAISNWARDKGWGMGAHAPRIVSPITGQEEAGNTTGVQFEITEASIGTWKRWWKAVRLEQFVTFFLVTLVAVVVFSLLAYRTLGDGYGGSEDLAFIEREGIILGQAYGYWVKVLFWVIGAVSLTFANLVVVDLVGRITSNILCTSVLRDSRTWTEAKLYSTVVWAVIALGIAILAAGLDQPLVLLAIAAVLNGMVMVVYSALLVRLNRSLHPRIAISSGRQAIMLLACLAYAAFTVYTLAMWVRAW